MAIYNVDGCGNLGRGKKKRGFLKRVSASGFRLPASSDFRLKDEALRIIIGKCHARRFGFPVYYSVAAFLRPQRLITESHPPLPRLSTFALPGLSYHALEWANDDPQSIDDREASSS